MNTTIAYLDFFSNHLDLIIEYELTLFIILIEKGMNRRPSLNDLFDQNPFTLSTMSLTCSHRTHPLQPSHCLWNYQLQCQDTNNTEMLHFQC